MLDKLRRAQALLVKVANELGDCDTSADIAEVVDRLDSIAIAVEMEDY